MTDHETADAVEALTYRLRTREPGTDDEFFAREFITALRARGWRPTEARPAPSWRVPENPDAPAACQRGSQLARELLTHRDQEAS